jgi:sugar phosphate permease
LVALWAVLGSGSWNLRVAILLLASILTATGLANYFAYLDSKYAGWPAGSILHTLVREDWNVWLWGQTLLMAALLLFVRSSGYRLVRSS